MEPKGSLFVVATPIGNMLDITFRAVKVLSFVDLVVAEDTRLTSRLLSYHGVKSRFLSLHLGNEVVRISGILEKLILGANIALVSNAGTPLISDPGFMLVRAAIDNSIDVVPVPGVSSVITALSVSGLPTNAFIYLGFLSRKKAKRLEQLRFVVTENKTLIFYESPNRIVSLLYDIVNVFGNRYVVLSRELTKINEEFIRGMALSVIFLLKNRSKIKGECTLLVSGIIDGFKY